MMASLVASLLIICLALISVSCSGTTTEEPIQGSGGLETTGSIPIVTPSPAIDPSTDSDDSGDVDIGSNTNQTDSPASITTTDPDPKSTETPAASPTPTPTESTAANGPLTDNALSHENLENTESVCSQSAIGTGTVPPPTVLPTSSKITAYQPIPVNSPCGNYPKITLRDWGESARSFESRRYYSNHFLEWTPDGDQIILNVPDKGDLFGSGVHLVNLDGPPHRYLVDANPGYSMRRGFQADLSPDGTMLVYTTCEFAFNGTTLLPEDLESYDQRRARKDYDLAILGIYDGTKRLLTKSSDTIYTGENPAWSSDGSQIAFLARKRSDYEGFLRLVTKNADGSDTRIIVPFEGREMIIRRPPAWSSDGNYIAFLQVGGPNRSSEYLYTVKQDGSELYGIVSTPR